MKMVKYAIGSEIIIALLLLITSFFNAKLKKRDSLIILLIILTGIVILSYYTKVTPGDDIERYFYQMDLFRYYGIRYAFNEGPWAETPLSTLLLYFVSKTSIYELLSAITSLIVWGVYFYVIYDSLLVETKDAEYIESSKLFIYLLFLIISTNIYSVISGVRSPISSSIVCFGLYLDLKKNKKLFACFLYFIATLFHVNALNVIVIRLALYISGNKKNSNNVLVLLPFFCILGLLFLKYSNLSYSKYVLSKMEIYAGFADNGLLWFGSKVIFYLGCINIALSIIPNENNMLLKKFYIAFYIYMLIMLFVFDYIPMRIQSLASVGILLFDREQKNKNYYFIGICFLIMWLILNAKYDLQTYSRWNLY